jgi:hypothetical protein
MVPLKCDAKGNLYVRGYQRGDPLGAPVVKFAPDGNQVATYALRTAPGFEKSGVALDFAVTPRGQVYLLATSRKERVIVRFGQGGEFERFYPLDQSFDPNHIAAFPSGEMLISGLRFSKQNAKLMGEPFVGVFDPLGRLLKEVKLEGDVAFSAQNETAVGPPEQENQKATAISPEEEDRYASVSLGGAFSAEDGHVYLYRAEKNPIVFVLAAGGEVVRRMVVPAPAENFRPISLRVSGGRILIQFEENVSDERQVPKQVFSLVDAYTGERILDYLPPKGVGGALACYAPDKLTFLWGGEDRTLHIQVVSP